MTMTVKDASERYRFVTADGRSTPWRKIPKHGIVGTTVAQARRVLGERFNLELRRNAAPGEAAADNE